MKIKRARCQKGSIRKIRLANGFAWEWRYRETRSNGKRKLKAIRFSATEYPTESSVLRAIEQKRILVNSQSGRHKVVAKFGVLTELYRKEHLPTLRHSTRGTNN
jgi:hypothetical protein